MTIELAAAIVRHLGPCRVAVEARTVRGLAAELALLGCDTTPDSADVVVTESDALSAALLARHPATRALVVLPRQVQAQVLDDALFAAGWRRLPGAVGVLTLLHLAGGQAPQPSFYERAPDGYRGLLNTNGPEALAALGRWTLAAERVRPGDHVLLCGPDAADGQVLLEACARARTVEVDAPAASHAPRSFDVIVALDAPGSWTDNIGRYAQLLKLDGRLVAGWSESNPQKPADWARLHQGLSADYLVESQFVQAPGVIVPQGVPQGEVTGLSWRIAVAAKGPLGGEETRARFVHPAFGASQATLAAFAEGYDNPWLYRTLVQMGERLADEDLLVRLAEHVASEARPGSADQGAALAVLGYRVLEARAADAVPVLLGAFNEYWQQGGDAPHVVRWRVSLAFLAGRLAEMLGERAIAKHWYARAASDDWQHFSTILATKAIGAAFFVARILLAEQDADLAWSWFERGVEITLQAAGRDHRQELGDGDGLLPFYLPELAEVIDMGSQCANALANRHLWARDPGLFWRQVDVKRFGIASWTLDVTKENERLRKQLGQA
ncbi:hypothetical protein [uncultured Sphingomonas sp.]|uniref:hypothetical protein n=1 Tax=uncultured Sphingomonas sp. TaxID=158754 RepID=UPI0025E23D93|nr:hypothetical protein [uncultured Sphingomonas sp.]